MKKLPESVRSVISASNQINNHTKSVEELVYNSLDAGATSVAIRVNISENLIQVIDNGCGITEKDLRSIGKNYMTSKFTDFSTLNSAPNTYGFRGQSLANIIQISKNVIVTSRHENFQETWKKVFKNGKEKNIERCDIRPSKGTTIEVKGFLYNLNIRKKEVGHDLQSIKTFLEHLALVHSNISLSLRDDMKNEIIFKMHKSRDVYQTLSSLYDVKKEDIHEYKVEKNEYKVRGILGNSDNDCQRRDIFLNGRYISESSKLHKIVNDYIKKYLNLKDRRILKIKNLNENNDNIQNKITFYFIFVTCPYLDYNLSSSPRQSVLEFKDWNQIYKLLEKLIKFSAGDVNLKELTKYAKDQPNCKKTDTREEIKKIMEKYLGNHMKKSVTHVHKGIKGKQVKRKIKQPSLSKIISKGINSNRDQNNLDNDSFSKNMNDHKLKKHDELRKFNLSNQSNFLLSNIVEKQCEAEKITKVGKWYNSKNRDITNNKENTKQGNKQLKNKGITKKTKKNTNNMINRKEINTHSFQKRYNKLKQEVNDMLNRIKQKSTEEYLRKSVQYSNNIIDRNRNVSVKKNVNEIIIHRYLPKSKVNKKPNVEDKATEKRFKTNYDLLETILKTQQDINNEQRIISCKPLTTSVDDLTQQRNHSEVCELNDLETNSNLVEPFDTFQSHDYFAYKNYSKCDKINLQPREKEASKSQTRKPRFITTRSRDNFECGKITKYSTLNKYSKAFTSNVKSLFKQTPTPFYDYNYMGTAEKSYIIDVTASNKIVADFVDIDEKWTQRTIKYNNKCKGLENEQVSIKNATYTLSNSYTLIRAPKQYENSKCGNNTCVDDMDTNCRLNESVDCEDAMDQNYIFVSKSEQQQIEHTVYPITLCETVMQSQEVVNTELNLNDEAYSSQINRKRQKTCVEENVEFTDTTLNCSQKKVSSEIRISLPNTEFQTSYFNLSRFEEQSHEVGVENQNNTDTVDNQNVKCYDINCEENIDNGDAFNLKNRPGFLPKGMSPIFENCNTKKVCQRNLSGDYYEQDMYKNFMDDILYHAEVFGPKIEQARDVTTKAIEKVNARLEKDNSCLKFDGSCLNDAKVLGQVDDKFIAAILKSKSSVEDASDFLVLFDQHAVHERIRLENNLSEYLVDNQWVSISVDEITFKISKDEASFLHNYKEKFMQLGLQWTILNHDEVTVNAIPAAILGKIIREVDKVIKAIKSLITEEINAIKMQNGCASLYPKSIMELVFSEACRYAIKFGQKLSKSRCVELLKMLSECKTPFQCAHGRPVMAVIMDMKYDEPHYNVNLQKVKEWKTKTGI